MNEPTDLVVYDFDDTTCMIPGPCFHKHLVKTVHPDSLPKIKDIDIDYMDWWEHPISLDTDVFDIPVVEQIRDYNLARQSDKFAHVLITRRSPSLLPSILKIIKSHGMRMDKCYTNEWSTKKVDILKEYLSETPSISSITICEDSYKNILDYKRGLDAFKYNIHYLFVTVPMIYKLDDRLKVLGEYGRISLKFKS